MSDLPCDVEPQDWRELSTEERNAYPTDLARQLRDAAIRDADDYPPD